jgi:hypothetical protein
MITSPVASHYWQQIQRPRYRFYFTTEIAEPTEV